MADGIRCAFNVKKLRATINCGNLDDATLLAIYSQVATEHPGLSEEQLLQRQNQHFLTQAIANRRSKKEAEDSATEKRLTVGDAPVYVGGRWNNNTPMDNPQTIYVFSDNLQAHNYDSENPTEIEGLIGMTEESAKRLKVGHSSAVVRRNSNNERNPNAVGIVVKKNAYSEKGEYLNEDEHQFTDAEQATVIELAKQTVATIKEMVATGKYKTIRMVDILGGKKEKDGSLNFGNARLTKSNAEAIAKVFEEELGIQSQVLQIKGSQWYAVEFQDPKGVDKKIEAAEAKKESKTASNRESALASLNAEDPTSQKMKEALAEKSKELSESASLLLNKVFNSYQERAARANLLSEMFSAKLTGIINEEVAYLETQSDDFLDSKIEGDSITYRQLLNKLTKGEAQEQRIAALKHLKKNGKPIMNFIYEDVKRIMKEYIAPYITEDGKFAEGNWREELVEKLYLGTEEEDPDMLWAIDFAEQAYQNDWVENGELNAEGWKNAKIQAENIVKAYYQMSDDAVYDTLWQDIIFDLELLENIRITGIKRVVEAQDDPNDEYEEGKMDANHEGYMIKYKLLDPSSSLSIKMKRFLGSMYKASYRNGVKSYDFDSLGRRIKMNPTAAYYSLLAAMDGMVDEMDLDIMLTEAVRQCPWLEGIMDTIIYNPDATDEEGNNPFDFEMRKEFYTTFKMSNTKFGKIDSLGFLVRLNKDSNVGTFMEKIAKNFEEHTILGPKSIYNEDGQINLENASEINSWLIIRKKKNGSKLVNKTEEEIKAQHPLAWAISVFDPSSFKRHTVPNIIEAINILRGEVKGLEHASLENLLRNIGIDTSTLSLDEGLLPAVTVEDVEEAVVASNYSIGYLEALNQLIGKNTMRDLLRVLNSIKIITNVSDTSKGQNVLRENDNIVTKFHGAYLTISSVIKDLSDGITKTSFRGPDGNDRYSFTAPDFITNFISAMHKEDDFSNETPYSPAAEYIEEHFGRMDYFKNQATEEWYNTWLEQLSTDPEIRAAFDYLNILSMHGIDAFGKKRDINIGDVAKADLIISSFFAYFAANDTKNGTKTAYYQNPLFSDVAAMIMLRMPRYSNTDKAVLDKGGFKKVIVELLAKTFEQELARINATINGKNDIEVEFFNTGNKNGEKFSLLLEFNKGIGTYEKPYKTRDGREIVIPNIEEIRSYLETLDASNDAASIAKIRKTYIEGLISDLMEYEFDRFIQDLNMSPEALEQLYKKRQKQQQKKIAKGLENEIDSETSDMNLLEEDEENDDSSVDDTTKTETMADLEEFFYNNFFAQGQMIQIFGGDIAYYKNFRDFIKRNKQAYASGKRLYARDQEGNPLYEKCLYLEDKEGFSSTYGVIKNLLSTTDALSTWEKDNLKGAIAAFEDICTTDGFSLRTLDSFKVIYQSMGGVWNEELEDAFNNLREGNKTVESFRAIIKQMKPFLYSYETRVINGRLEKIPVQHKNSEYILGALLGAMTSKLSQSPMLKGLQQFMEEKGYDVVHFHSVVKEGFFNAVDLSYDRAKFAKKHPGESYDKWLKGLKESYKQGKITTEEFNAAIKEVDYSSQEAVYNALVEQTCNNDEARTLREEMIHQFPLSDLMIVQPSQEHLVDEDALYGSQLRNIIPADLPEDFTMEISIGTDHKTGKSLKKTLNREEAVKYYNTLLVDQLLSAYGTVSEEFSSLENLHKALMAKIADNSKYGEDVKKALELEYETVTVNGETKKIAKRFKLPFTSPNLTNKIEELILSSFKNAIQKQRIEGGNAYLISDFGLSDDLCIHWKTKDGKALSIEEAEKLDKKDLCIDYIPCYLPYTRANELKDFCHQNEDGYFVFDYDKMKEAFGEQGVSKILDIIGYRIPTEDKYSIMPIRIMGYLPAQAGSSMVLPSDIIAMSGTDFDIDKLYLMRRAVRRDVYSRDLRKAFAKWLQLRKAGSDAMQELLNQVEQFKEANSDSLSLKEFFNILIGEETDVTPEVEKLANRLLNQAGDLTEEEVSSVAKKNPLFEEFLRAEGYKYILKGKDGNPQPKYRILTPRAKFDGEGQLDLDAMSKSANKDERNNMLIDVIWNTLTSPGGSKLSMLPGSYPTVKYASRMQRIMHDKAALQAFKEQYADLIKAKGGIYEALMSFKDSHGVSGGIKILEKHYEEFATTQSPLSILDYANNFRNLMDGNDLIGVYAVNSSSHYKFQFLKLKLKPQAQFSINGVNIVNIDQVTSPLNGLRIGRICAEMQAASPDNGKDPTLGDLNASKATASFMGFLARIGLDLISIGTINNSRALLDVAAMLDPKRYPVKTIKFDLDTTRIGEMFIALQLSNDAKDFIDNSSEDDLMYLAQYAHWFKKINGNPRKGIDGVAKELSNASAISRSDSPNGALTISIAEVTQQKLKAQDFIEDSHKPKFSIDGFDEFIDIELDPTSERFAKDKEALRSEILKSRIPRMQAVYTLGLAGGYSLCKQWLPAMSDVALKAANDLRSLARQSMTSSSYTTFWKGFFNQMLMYVLTDSELFGTEADGKTIMEKRNFFIHDLPMKYKEFCSKTNGKGKYIHQNWRQTSAFNCLSNKSEKGIHFESGVSASKSKQARRIISSEFNQLLSSSNVEEQQMALALFMYSFYENGNSFRYNSFGLFFDTDFLLTVPEYADILRSVADKLQQPGYLDDFVLQFMINNPSLIPAVGANMATYNNQDETIKINGTSKNARELVSSGRKKDDVGNPVKLLKYGKSVFYLIDDVHLIYKKINGTIPGKTLYYDAKSKVDEIDYTQLKGAGIIAKLDSEKKAKAAKPNEDVNKRVEEMQGVDGNPDTTAPKDEDVTTSEQASYLDGKDESGDITHTPVEETVDAERLLEAAKYNAGVERGDNLAAPKDSEFAAPKERTLEELNDGNNNFCK